ncbi:hypothetical protein KKB99_00495 [bacterium]|nr:hypothetical protein [bacterium]MBU1024464.1 hypothetical protein [bacterium]
MKAQQSDKDLFILALGILENANQGGMIRDFLNLCITSILDFADCDLVGIYLGKSGFQSCCARKNDSMPTSNPDTLKSAGKSVEITEFGYPYNKAFDFIIRNVLKKNEAIFSEFLTKNGSLVSKNIKTVLNQAINAGFELDFSTKDFLDDFNSVSIFRIMESESILGLLILKSHQEGYFSANDIEFHERISNILGISIVNHRTQTALRERIKELSSLYTIAQIAAEPEFSLDEVLQNITRLLPLAWQYPEITISRIILDGKTYSTEDFRTEFQSQSAEISIRDINRGIIEVAYSEMMPELDEGPFLKEERNLIDTIASLVAQIIERKQAEEDQLRLQNQLRHADRLATIGQLAAGVAHEFNEPLGNVLGLAQLILKNDNLTDDIRKDIDKIISASLHAREVIKKLMIFARQRPAKTASVNLNDVINEGLYFLEARCTKAGIEMEKLLDSHLPEIQADQAQMHQVLINLVVNAIHATPDGGKITITTGHDRKNVILIITDTGTGMSEEVKKQLFIPFFTTKDVDIGTGLGLPVVHGIVTSHGGTIKVTSNIGEGSCFEIKLPLKGFHNVKAAKNGNTKK